MVNDNIKNIYHRGIYVMKSHVQCSVKRMGKTLDQGMLIAVRGETDALHFAK